ncbi:MAG TPA: 30S ribosomal protein S12 methylthiotransferase RimO [Peptococcaceae bacterium]|nr:MAG: Ribosomal protein S12 methylthiotransferase RimO [Moorella sp. 60_41]HBT46388.1 30S ribosomal protein S12 methylthiotransferase RimO [Peptococcaceae bacterium]
MVRIAVITLGCAKNEVDSEYMLGVLENRGYEVVETPEEAEVVIVNTCSFIRAAKEEALQTILGLASGREEGYPVLIVAGCLAQQHGAELWQELPEVGAFIGPEAIPRLPEIIEGVLRGERLVDIPGPGEGDLRGLPRRRVANGPSAYLKIAEGCDNACTYCTIPFIKGPYRSRPKEELVREAEWLVSRGARELVLVAQDTTAYGRDLYGKYALPELLKALTSLPGVRWLRLLYAYPTRITPELIEVMAGEDKVCAYLDLPMQHAHPDILRAMGRAGTLAVARKVITRLKTCLPHIALRSTFIVGFPGEREEHFRELLGFLEEVRFDWVGAYTYSPEEGTPAAAMLGQVPGRVKRSRYRRLLVHQEPITEENNAAWVGRELEVLVEEKAGDGREEVYVGRSFRQAPEVDGVIYLRGKCRPGDMVRARITSVEGVYDLGGEVVV